MASKREKINVKPISKVPGTYACDCKYCQEYKGMLIRKNGSLYNRNERRKYMEYKHGGGGAQHINPTPCHIARWAIQTFTKPRDLVIDPFTGTGTTLCEATNHVRDGFGTEIDTVELARRNIISNQKETISKYGIKYATATEVVHGDARNIGQYLNEAGLMGKAQLVVLHPPYSGDEQSNAKYDRSVEKNMAFMKENAQYWKDMEEIFKACYDALQPGGYAVIGVKEMMRNKKWSDLHIKYSDILNQWMEYQGMYLLPHYPRTLHLNTYYNRWGVHPSYYQTITVFKKGE